MILLSFKTWQCLHDLNEVSTTWQGRSPLGLLSPMSSLWWLEFCCWENYLNKVSGLFQLTMWLLNVYTVCTVTIFYTGNCRDHEKCPVGLLTTEDDRIIVRIRKAWTLWFNAWIFLCQKFVYFLPVFILCYFRKTFLQKQSVNLIFLTTLLAVWSCQS